MHVGNAQCKAYKKKLILGLNEYYYHDYQLNESLAQKELTPSTPVAKFCSMQDLLMGSSAPKKSFKHRLHVALFVRTDDKSLIVWKLRMLITDVAWILFE